MEVRHSRRIEAQASNRPQEDDELPQCKIKRNYSCNHCAYFTQNPRFHLTHLRDIHGERIAINKCNLCLYASRHYQKLVRHMKMVHGSAAGIAGQSRKRAAGEESECCLEEKNVCTPPAVELLQPLEITTQCNDFPKALELSRRTLKDLAVLYFSEEEVRGILAQMEKADSIQFSSTTVAEDLSITVKRESPVNTFADEIKKTLIHEEDLNCPCGHVSKSFSETFVHRRACSRMRDGHFGEASSTKSAHPCTTDLVNHPKDCPQYGVLQDHTLLQEFENNSWDEAMDEANDGILDLSKKEVAEPFEKKTQDKSGVETSSPSDETIKESLQEADASSSSFKKVFKCPRCSFWASTASRFHVHIVGHLNRKPFKCSLCTYRSNWRWDITKHIRLKSIRNPCHKNARVLMNDDTGQLNYTKYNKYITRMKINDEDGDPRLIKTGEMTTDQESSLEDQADMTKGGECKDESIEKSRREQESSKDEKEKVLTSLGKHSNDLIVDLTGGVGGRAFHKCPKCYFRHANRDAVLAHLRCHHPPDPHLRSSPSTFKGEQRSSLQTTGNPERLCTNNFFTAAVTPTEKKSTQASKQCAIRGKETDSTETKDPIKKTAGNRDEKVDENHKTSSGPISKSTSSEASSARNLSPAILMKAITASNFCKNAPERKGPSPFRCGHCHQVSNWKHVIQRHCRLKHSGNIRIEAFNRSSDGRTPTYRSIDFSGNGQQRRGQDTTSDCHLQEPMKQPTQSPADKSVHYLQDSLNSSSNSDQDSLMNSLQMCSKQLKHQQSATSQTSLQRSSQRVDLKVHKSSVDPNPSDSKEKTTASPLVQAETTNGPKCRELLMKSPKNEQQLVSTHGPGQEPKCSARDSSTNPEILVKSHSLLQEKSQQTAKDCKERQKTVVMSKSGVRTFSPFDADKPAASSTPKSTPSIKSIDNSQKWSSSTKCPYCPFKTDCSKALHRHLEHHIRVSNLLESNLCDYCDFSTPSKEEFNEHTRLHFEFMNNKNLATFYTSFDNLELTVTDRDEKPMTKTVQFKSEPKPPRGGEEMEKENLRGRKCSGAARKIEKKPTPATTDQKTILVNPKTGQIIRRN